MVSQLIPHGFWILDAGANNHMTGEQSLFVSPFTPIDELVHIADGSLIFVHSQGDVYLSSDITLSFVYYILDFACNLMSVNRLTNDHNCVIVFLLGCCYLQDLTLKKIFGKGYERNGLYYLSAPS